MEHTVSNDYFQIHGNHLSVVEVGSRVWVEFRHVEVIVEPIWIGVQLWYDWVHYKQM